jgi:hypothetical protein
MRRLYAHLCRRAETAYQCDALATFGDHLLGVDYDEMDAIFLTNVKELEGANHEQN